MKSVVVINFVIACTLALTLSSSPVCLGAQDTVRVKANGPPRWGAQIALTQDWSIGQIAGPDELAFGMVSAFAVDKAGRFYVFDSKDKQIRQYSPNAAFVRTIGRSGKGPGEYEWVMGMDIANDSILAIHDLSAGRVSYFLPSGKLLTSVTEPRATWGIENTFVIDSRGLAYLAIPKRASRGEAPLSESDMVGTPTLLMITRDGKSVDSLAMPTHLSRSPRESFYLNTADGGNNNFLPVSHHASLRSGGYVFGTSNASHIIVRPLRGPVRVIERSWNRVPVGSAERANWQEYATNFAARDGGGRDYTIPSTKPYFRDLFADYDNRIWVSMYADAQKISLPPRDPARKGPRLYWQQPATYDVLTVDGVYLGRVVLPMRARILAARGQQLWTLVKGADDEDMIRRYTVRGSSGTR